MSTKPFKNATVSDESGLYRMNQEEILQRAVGPYQDSLKVTTDSALLIAEIEEGATYTYIGHAKPGTGTDAAQWRIRRVENSTGSSRVAEAGQFSNVWDNRASLTYA